MKFMNESFSGHPSTAYRITIPTLFTSARLILIPFIIGGMIGNVWGHTFIFFIAAALTDVIDGFWARFFNCKTFLGACLDAIADKLLLLSIFSTLAFLETPLFTIPRWFVVVVLLKELVMIFGSAFIYFTKGSLKVQPTVLGKLTTFVQVCFIVWLFSCYFFNWLPIKTYHVMLGLLLVLSLACLADYSLRGYNYYKNA